MHQPKNNCREGSVLILIYFMANVLLSASLIQTIRLSDGGGVKKDNDILRRLLDALFLTDWNLANYHFKVENIATVDVLDVIYITPCNVT